MKKATFRRLAIFALMVIASTAFVGLDCNSTKPPEVSWSKTYDSGADDAAHAIAVDASGSVYVGGSSNNGSNLDFCTLKYDSLGNLLWNKAYDGANRDEVLGLVVSGSGDVYVTGASVEDSNCIRLVKYDASGNLVWNKVLMNNAYAYDMAAGASGSIYIAGRKVNATSADFALIKTDADGNVGWSRTYDNDNNEQAHGVAVDNSDNIYVTGFSMPEGSGSGGSDFLTLKYAADGTLLWNRIYDSGHKDDVLGHGVAVDMQGDVYVAGYTTVTGTAGEYLIVKYNPDGDTLWTRTNASDNTDPTASIATNVSGSVFLLGTRLSNDNYDYMIAKYDSKGILEWDTIFDSGKDDYGSDICLGNDGSIYVTGTTTGDDKKSDFLTVKLKPE